MIRDSISILTLCFVVLFVGVVTAEESTMPPPKQSRQTPGVLRVQSQPDQIVEVRTKTRHTTVLVLPRGENILDFVVGDSDYWHLSGSANLAYLKPLDEKVQTNVALVCESGTIYSFLVKEAPDPHLVVRIEAGPRHRPDGPTRLCRPVGGRRLSGNGPRRRRGRTGGQGSRRSSIYPGRGPGQKSRQPIQDRLPRPAVLRLPARQEGLRVALPG